MRLQGLKQFAAFSSLPFGPLPFASLLLHVGFCLLATGNRQLILLSSRAKRLRAQPLRFIL
jgi:hypothetical protein